MKWKVNGLLLIVEWGRNVFCPQGYLFMDDVMKELKVGVM